MAEEREYTQAAYDRHLRGRDEYPVVARRETVQYMKDPSLDPQRCREVFVGSMDRRSHSRGGVDEGSEQVGWWSSLPWDAALAADSSPIYQLAGCVSRCSCSSSAGRHSPFCILEQF